MACKRELEKFLLAQGHLTHTKEDVYEMVRILSCFESVRKGRHFEESEIISRGRFELFKAFMDSRGDCGVSIRFEGGHPEAERGKAVFTEFEDMEDVPLGISLLELELSGIVGHRDLLGAVLSLGVKRSKVGDIRVAADKAFMYVSEDMAGYVEQNLMCIGKTEVKSINNISCSSISLPAAKYKQVEIIVASMRADLVIARHFKVSRSQAKIDVGKGKIKLNDFILSAHNHLLKERDVVSYRGKGKCKIDSIGGTTKKGNKVIKIKKYV